MQPSDQQRLIDELCQQVRSMHAKGKPLNISAVKREAPDLLAKAFSVRPFLGWKGLLERAGLDYREINQELKETVSCLICGEEYGNLAFHLWYKHSVSGEEYRELFPGTYLTSEVLRSKMFKSDRRLALPHWEFTWSKEYIMDRIAAYLRLNYSLDTRTIERLEPSLRTAARAYFGAWKHAIAAIGEDPRRHRLVTEKRHLSKEEIIAYAKNRVAEGLAVNCASILASDSAIATAGIRKFGSWTAVLRAAGIAPEQHVQSREFSSSEVAELIAWMGKIAQLNGEERANAMAKVPYRAERYVTRHGHGWARFAREHGLPPHKFTRRAFPNKVEVVEAVRQLPRGFKAAELRRSRPLLYSALARYFGANQEVFSRIQEGKVSG